MRHVLGELSSDIEGSAPYILFLSVKEFGHQSYTMVSSLRFEIAEVEEDWHREKLTSNVCWRNEMRENAKGMPKPIVYALSLEYRCETCSLYSHVW